MKLEEQLIEALRRLPSPDQEKVLALVRRLQHRSGAPESLYDRARRLGAVGIVTDAPPDLSTNKGYLAFDPHPQPRYTLAELMTQCDPDAPKTEEDRAC